MTTASLQKKRYKLYFEMGHMWCAGDCGRRIPYDQMTIDHIIPKSKGGTDRWPNLQLMCGPCNNRKGDRIA
jgi:5-methylcytosine-specific restriction endonuclease McrA